MRYARLLLTFTRLELQYALEYRLNFVLDLVLEAVTIGTSIAAVLVIFTYTQALNGWTLPQMLVLLGVYYFVQGAEELLFQTSFERFMEQVRLGTLDFTLLKPASSQFLVSGRYIQAVQIGQVLMGLTVLGIGLGQLRQEVSVVSVVAFGLTLAGGVILVYSLMLVLSTFSFWLVRVENILAIFWAFLDAGRFPVDLYPGWLRITLSTVVPIGIAVTIPARSIVGHVSGWEYAAFACGTVAAVAFSHWFWNLGIRSYTGASA